MAAARNPNKSKFARRIIEILEYFDEETRHATASDIARRYHRPQSSTWELLSSLVELGLLYKDPGSRLFRPTPRAAMLGAMFQPRLVRDGRLAVLADSLKAATGLAAAVVGMVGLNAQIFRWTPGARPIAAAGGSLIPLHRSAAGWLLLSTLPPARREGVLRRLRAEAPEAERFSLAELEARIQACGGERSVAGPAGFGQAQMCAMLLPAETGEPPMALALVHEPGEAADPAALAALLERSVREGLADEAADVAQLHDWRPSPERKAAVRA
jgi:DNA-binding IclR family transcriptional regulator